MKKEVKKKKNDINTKAEKKRVEKALEAYAICGDVRKAARLVGAGLNNVYRALQDPDGISKLQEYLKRENPGDYLVLNPEQRKSFLTKCIIGGIMPRVVFDMSTGEPTNKVIFDELNPTLRIKLIDMLNKMDGVYVEKKEIIDKTERKGLSPFVKNKLSEVYDLVEPDEEEDILAPKSNNS